MESISEHKIDLNPEKPNVQNAGINHDQVIELLKITNGYLPRIKLEYEALKAEMRSLEAKTCNSARVYQQFKMLMLMVGPIWLSVTGFVCTISQIGDNQLGYVGFRNYADGLRYDGTMDILLDAVNFP